MICFTQKKKSCTVTDAVMCDTCRSIIVYATACIVGFYEKGKKE